MNPTPKIDNCIKMMDELLISISPIYYNINARFDKEHILRWQTKINAIIGFKLLPLLELRIGDHLIANKEECMSFLKNHNIPFSESYFDAEWDVIKNYEIVATDDIRNEFWRLCPTPNEIPQYLNIINKKFDKVLSRIPNKDDFSFKNIVLGERANNYNYGIRERQNRGILTEKEADGILFFIHNTVEILNFKEYHIKSIFDELKGVGGEKTVNLPNDLNTDRAIRYFKKAIEAKLIVQSTNGFIWEDNVISRLAYFTELIFCRNDENKDNGNDYPETSLNLLFNVSRLGKARSQLSGNKEGKPKKHEDIDTLFGIN